MEMRPDLNTENVLMRITSYDIFRRYCENFTSPEAKFCSTFRSDPKPSCIIGIVGGDLLYKDFGETGSYRAIPYVARKFGVSYRDALQIINEDFSLGLGTSTKALTPISHEAEQFQKKIKENVRKETILKVKYKDFSAKDLSYWGQYYWTLEMLKSVDIKPISHFWIDNERNNFRMFTPWGLTYTMDYYYHKGVFRRKIYQPFNKEMKFLSNIDETIVQGYKRLDKTGDMLVITSSLKDCGIFWRLGINAVAPNSESTFLPSEFLAKYMRRYKRVIIWFDNDYQKEGNPGVTNAKKFAEIYGIDYFHTPDNTEKDPSDFAKAYGLTAFKEYFYSVI
jgi:hypothetical protein